MEAQREQALAKLGALEQQLEQDLARCERPRGAAPRAHATVGIGPRHVYVRPNRPCAAAEAEEKLDERMSLFAEMRLQEQAQQGTSDLFDLAQKASLPGVRGALGSFLASARGRPESRAGCVGRTDDGVGN